MTGGRVERRLAAVLAADVAGYSRLMGANELGTLEALKAIRHEIFDPAIAGHKGRIVKTTGDGMLVEFASAVDAVTCAVAVQESMAERKGPITFRIGINIGDIISDENDIFGDGVNVAARVESECAPGGVCLSGSAFEQVRGKTKFEFYDLGERSLKNIDRPIRLHSVRLKDAPKATIPDSNPPLALPDKPSIAVLPFQNMSGDPEQEYFADGIVEDIITALSRFKSLFVIARNSSFTYKGKIPDIRQVGHELGVHYVLEGSVRKAGGRLRITAQLIETAFNHHVWADKFDGALADVFDLQDKITEQVVGAIAPAVEAAEIGRAKIKRSDSVNAYDLCLRAKACLDQLTYNANQEGLELVYRAVEAAPNFAKAYALGADLYVQRNSVGMPFDRDKEVPEALRLARRAADLSRDDPEVLTSAALAIGNLLGDTAANAMLDRAIELNPNLARAWGLRGMGFLFVNEPMRGIEYAQRALRLTPLDPDRDITLGTISLAFVQLERYDEAYEWAEKSYDARETPRSARNVIVSATLSGRHERSREVLHKLLTEYPDITAQRLLQGLSRWHGQREKRQLQEALRLAGVPE